MGRFDNHHRTALHDPLPSRPNGPRLAPGPGAQGKESASLSVRDAAWLTAAAALFVGSVAVAQVHDV